MERAGPPLTRLAVPFLAHVDDADARGERAVAAVLTQLLRADVVAALPVAPRTAAAPTAAAATSPATPPATAAAVALAARIDEALDLANRGDREAGPGREDRVARGEAEGRVGAHRRPLHRLPVGPLLGRERLADCLLATDALHRSADPRLRPPGQRLAAGLLRAAAAAAAALRGRLGRRGLGALDRRRILGAGRLLLGLVLPAQLGELRVEGVAVLLGGAGPPPPLLGPPSSAPPLTALLLTALLLTALLLTALLLARRLRGRGGVGLRGRGRRLGSRGRSVRGGGSRRLGRGRSRRVRGRRRRRLGRRRLGRCGCRRLRRRGRRGIGRGLC